MGLWSHAARVCTLWRIWQNPVYKAFEAQYQKAALGVDSDSIRITWTPTARAYLQLRSDDLNWAEPNKPFRWGHWL